MDIETPYVKASNYVSGIITEMTIGKVKYLTNEEIELRRYIVCAHQISTKFYQNQRYLITNILQSGRNLIFFPQVSFSKVHDFWKQVYSVDQNTKFDISFFSSLLPELRPSFQDTKSAVEIMTGKMEVHKTEFENIIRYLSKSDEIINIEIEIVSFGSDVSFYFEESKSMINMSVIVRADMLFESVVEGIISNLVNYYQQKEKKEFSWYAKWNQNEAIVDYLMKNTQLNKFVPNYIGTLDSLDQANSFVLDVKRSLEYYSVLGFPMEQMISSSEDTIYVFGKDIKKSLSPAQNKILKLLIEKKNSVVSFNDLGDAVWEKGSNKFSLWALAKHVQRIRDVLLSLGINQQLIYNIRGEGYLLQDGV